MSSATSQTLWLRSRVYAEARPWASRQTGFARLQAIWHTPPGPQAATGPVTCLTRMQMGARVTFTTINATRHNDGSTHCARVLVLAFTIAASLSSCGTSEEPSASRSTQTSSALPSSRTTVDEPVTASPSASSSSAQSAEVTPGEAVIVTWRSEDPEPTLSVFAADDGALVQETVAATPDAFGDYFTDEGSVNFEPCDGNMPYGPQFVEHCGTAVFPDGREVVAVVGLTRAGLRFVTPVPPPPTDFGSPPPTKILSPTYDPSGKLWWVEADPTSNEVTVVNEDGESLVMPARADSIVRLEFDRAGEGYLTVAEPYGGYLTIYFTGETFTDDEILPHPTVISHVDEILPPTEFDLSSGIYEIGGARVAFLGIPPGLTEKESSLFVAPDSGDTPRLLAEGINAETVLFFGPYR